MSAITKKEPSIVNSGELGQYKLPAQMKKVLAKFGELIDYMALMGKTPPHLRITRRDYVDLDSSIRKQSAGQRTLAEVRHRGYSVLSAAD